MLTDLNPATAPELRAALATRHAESVAYWNTFSTPAFLAPIGNAWSPAENVRHLTKSMRAVTKGLRVPRILILLRFGRATGTSRSYTEMRDFYRMRVKGADAGTFGPGARTPLPNAEHERAQLMDFHAQAVRELNSAIAAWPERALDRRRLPHPLLGPITVREMLFFTLYHNQHHVDNVVRRMGQ